MALNRFCTHVAAVLTALSLLAATAAQTTTTYVSTGENVGSMVCLSPQAGGQPHLLVVTNYVNNGSSYMASSTGIASGYSTSGAVQVQILVGVDGTLTFSIVWGSPNILHRVVNGSCNPLSGGITDYGLKTSATFAYTVLATDVLGVYFFCDPTTTCQGSMIGALSYVNATYSTITTSVYYTGTASAAPVVTSGSYVIYNQNFAASTVTAAYYGSVYSSMSPVSQSGSVPGTVYTFYTATTTSSTVYSANSVATSVMAQNGTTPAMEYDYYSPTTAIVSVYGTANTYAPVSQIGTTAGTSYAFFSGMTRIITSYGSSAYTSTVSQSNSGTGTIYDVFSYNTVTTSTYGASAGTSTISQVGGIPGTVIVTYVATTSIYSTSYGSFSGSGVSAVTSQSGTVPAAAFAYYQASTITTTSYGSTTGATTISQTGTTPGTVIQAKLFVTVSAWYCDSTTPSAQPSVAVGTTTSYTSVPTYFPTVIVGSTSATSTFTGSLGCSCSPTLVFSAPTIAITTIATAACQGNPNLGLWNERRYDGVSVSTYALRSDASFYGPNVYISATSAKYETLIFADSRYISNAACNNWTDEAGVSHSNSGYSFGACGNDPNMASASLPPEMISGIGYFVPPYTGTWMAQPYYANTKAWYYMNNSAYNGWVDNNVTYNATNGYFASNGYWDGNTQFNGNDTGNSRTYSLGYLTGGQPYPFRWHLADAGGQVGTFHHFNFYDPLISPIVPVLPTAMQPCFKGDVRAPPHPNLRDDARPAQLTPISTYQAWTSIGCFYDQYDPSNAATYTGTTSLALSTTLTAGAAFESLATKGVGRTNENCLYQCQIAGLPYCGMRNGVNCYGDTSMRAIGAAVTPLPIPNLVTRSTLAASAYYQLTTTQSLGPLCTNPCVGNNRQNCGGANAITIWGYNGSPPPTAAATWAPVPTGSGCVYFSGLFPSGSAYSQTYPGILKLNLDQPRTGYRNIEQCFQNCQSYGLRYCGLFSGVWCLGDSTTQSAATAVSGSCTLSCPGNPSESCGGPSALQLYSFVPTAAVYTTTAGWTPTFTNYYGCGATQPTASQCNQFPTVYVSVPSAPTTTVYQTILHNFVTTFTNTGTCTTSYLGGVPPSYAVTVLPLSNCGTVGFMSARYFFSWITPYQTGPTAPSVTITDYYTLQPMYNSQIGVYVVSNIVVTSTIPLEATTSTMTTVLASGWPVSFEQLTGNVNLLAAGGGNNYSVDTWEYLAYVNIATTGLYHIRVRYADDSAKIWFGTLAYSGWNSTNYLLDSTIVSGNDASPAAQPAYPLNPSGNPLDFTTTLNAQSFYPIRVILQNRIGAGNLEFSIYQGSTTATESSSVLVPASQFVACINPGGGVVGVAPPFPNPGDDSPNNPFLITPVQSGGY